MRNSNISITIDFRKFSEIWINCFVTEFNNMYTDEDFNGELNAYLLCDYIWLSKQEQTIFTTQTIEYVITHELCYILSCEPLTSFLQIT